MGVADNRINQIGEGQEKDDEKKEEDTDRQNGPKGNEDDDEDGKNHEEPFLRNCSRPCASTHSLTRFELSGSVEPGGCRFLIRKASPEVCKISLHYDMVEMEEAEEEEEDERPGDQGVSAKVCGGVLVSVGGDRICVRNSKDSSGSGSEDSNMVRLYDFLGQSLVIHLASSREEVEGEKLRPQYNITVRQVSEEANSTVFVYD